MKRNLEQILNSAHRVHSLCSISVRDLEYTTFSSEEQYILKKWASLNDTKIRPLGWRYFIGIIGTEILYIICPQKKNKKNVYIKKYKRTMYEIPEPLGTKYPQMGWLAVKVNLSINTNYR